MRLNKQSCSSENESRPVLTGVHIELDHNKLICAATDSHRLAIRETLISTNMKANCTKCNH